MSPQQVLATECLPFASTPRSTLGEWTLERLRIITVGLKVSSHIFWGVVTPETVGLGTNVCVVVVFDVGLCLEICFELAARTDAAFETTIEKSYGACIVC